MERGLRFDAGSQSRFELAGTASDPANAVTEQDDALLAAAACHYTCVTPATPTAAKSSGCHTDSSQTRTATNAVSSNTYCQIKVGPTTSDELTE